MAENKKSVLLYCDIIHTVEPLTNEEAGRLFKHYLRYINDLNPCAEDRLTTLLFEPIKQNLKRDLKKWEDKSLKNKENAKMRWDANACERMQDDANHADKDTVTVTDTVIVNVKDKVIDKFIPPKFEEVSEYCLERGNKVDPDKWFNHYTSNGWKVGKNNMKDWRAAIRTWEKNNFNKKETGSIDKAQQSHDEAKKLLGL